MSDFYGVFESIEGSSGEKKIATRETQRKLDAAIRDVKSQYGTFLYASRDSEEWNDRVALCKDDMIKTVNQSIIPNTGVMRRIVKACRDDWKTATLRTAEEYFGDEHKHVGEAPPDSMPPGGEEGGNVNMQPPGTMRANRHRADKVKELDPQGDWEAYLKSVDSTSDAAVENCFKEGFYRQADSGYQDTFDIVTDKKNKPAPGTTPTSGESSLFRTPDDQNPTLGGGRTPDGKVIPAETPGARKFGPPEGKDSVIGKGGKGGAPAANPGSTNPAPAKGGGESPATLVSGQGGTSGQGGSGGSGGSGGGQGGSGGKGSIGAGEYTIQSGDTYADIAQRAGWGDDYKGMAKATGYQVGNEDNIFAGETMNVVAPGGKGGSGGGSGNFDFLPTGFGGKQEPTAQNYQDAGVAAPAPTIKAQSSLAVSQYIDWCDSFGARRASIKNLDIYAQNLNDAAYFEIASALTDSSSPIYRSATSTDENGLITNNPVSVAPKALDPVDLGAGAGAGFGGGGPGAFDLPGFGHTGKRRNATGSGPAPQANGSTGPMDGIDPGGLSYGDHMVLDAIGSGQNGLSNGLWAAQGQHEGRRIAMDGMGGPGKSQGQYGGGQQVNPDEVKAMMGGGEEPSTWDTEGLQRDFHVDGFSAPFVVVRRKSDGQKGSLEFNRGSGPDNPRMYHSFRPHHAQKRTAAPDYLQKADEALTNLLNQKAEEFQETISPLQQALQTVQQAEQAQQAANPMGVQPPAGTVNVLPGQGDPAAGGAPAGGGDPSGGVDPAMLQQLIGGGGGMPPGGADPSMGGGGDPQQMMARRRRQAAEEEERTFLDGDWIGQGASGKYPFSYGPRQFDNPPNKHIDYESNGWGSWYDDERDPGDYEGRHRAEDQVGNLDVPPAEFKRRGPAGYDKFDQGLGRHRETAEDDWGHAFEVSRVDGKYTDDLGGHREWRDPKGEVEIGGPPLETDYRGKHRAEAANRGKGRGAANRPQNRVQRSSGVVDDFDEFVQGRGVEDASAAQSFADQQNYSQRGINVLKQHTGQPALQKAMKPKSRTTPNGKPGKPKLTAAQRKQAWQGWGTSQSFSRRVAGWEWDDHLNGYLASKPNDFTCKCGALHAVPSYSICKCGKIWNSYVIGTGGDNHTASVEKFICREIPVRENVIVANRKTAMPRPKNSEYHNAYNAGWNASNRTTTYDMGAALERYKGPHIDHFDMGWTDHASDYVHRFRQPEQYLADYKAMYAPHYDDFELHPETRELVQRKQGSRRTANHLNITETAPPRDRPVVLMYGGGFNPPHEGHVGALADAHRALTGSGYRVDGSIVVPTADKLLANKLAPEDRLSLSARAKVVRAAFPEQIDGAPVRVATEPSEEVERRPQKPRRSDLAAWAQRHYPNHTIVNVTGEDAVVPGAPDQHPSLYSGALGSNHGGVSYLTLPRDSETSMSSSKIRAAVSAGLPIPGMTPEAEQAYREELERHRASYRQARTAKEGGCTCWEGYERVPGTKPCADGSCRKKSNRNRRAEKVTRHNLSDPGPLGKGKDDKMPTIKEDLGDEWYRHGPGGKWVARKKTR
jgi:hypothetical protein